MTITLQKITLGTHQVSLLLAKERRLVSVDGHIYESLEDLVKSYPEMKSPEEIYKIAQVANFIFAPDHYEVILDPTKFQNSYQKRLEEDSRLKEFGISKVSEITPPKIIEDMFIFYVEDVGNNIPYRVSCPFPPSSPVNYENLSFE